MPVIDVDTHFEFAGSMEEHPLREWAERFPSATRLIADNIAGDMYYRAPERSRPAREELASFLNPENTAFVAQACEPGRQEPFFVSSAEERVAWMDVIGIDAALINPGGGYGFMVGYVGDDTRRAIERCNDYLADALSDHVDRLFPVSLVDQSDPSLAAAELERMRARGSRAFWVRAEPVDGRSLAHPEWDRMWSAATDLGMVAVLHVGNTPASFEGWANAGWELPGGTGLGGFFRYANCLRHQAAEAMLLGMTFAGAFGRHPNLTIITEELQLAWLPTLLWRAQSLAGAGPWPFELRPDEMVRRNVRATPLPGMRDRDLLGTMLEKAPEMLVFSSDYPHGEGCADPMNLYEHDLSSWTDAQREAFFSGSILDCFARMGDPLALPLSGAQSPSPGAGAPSKLKS